MERCPWCEGFDLYRDYHDFEWGVPLHDERALFELLILEGAQAGLSWATVLKKRQHYLALKAGGQSFNDFLWRFVDGQPIQNRWRSMAEVPTKTAQSDAMSKALQRAGFKFVGSAICYAFMQASGMVNDHLLSCPRHSEVQNPGKD